MSRATEVAQRRADLIEDIEWMLDTGSPVEEIADRLGATTVALERRMHRAGRHDLARTFRTLDRSKYWRARRRAQGSTCIDCGGYRSRESTGRCIGCSNRAKAAQGKRGRPLRAGVA